jgi:protein MpaA
MSVCTYRRLMLAAAAVLLATASGGAVTAHASGAPQESTSTIGTSVRGRPITVVHRAGPGATRRVVVIGDIHGDEQAGLRVVRQLQRGAQPADLDLWLIRTVNPDGTAANRRTNAHGVDLNRNFPYRWREVGRGTRLWSGPRAASEPETRSLQRLVRRIRPDLIVTFHQPLFGVGANEKGMPVVRALAAGMGLPVKTFHCSGVCNGSFTSWVNSRTSSLAVTVEFGPTVSASRISRAAAAIRRVGAAL